MSTTVQSLPQGRALARPEVGGALGLVVFGLFLLSTLDETVLAVAGRALALVSFAVLTVVNVGAAVGVYIGAAMLFGEHHFEGQGSWVARPDNYALLLLVLYLVAVRAFGRSTGPFGWVAVAVGVFVASAVLHLIALIGVDPIALPWMMRMFGIPLGLCILLRRAALTQSEVRALLLVIVVIGLLAALITVFLSLGWYSLIVPPWLVDPAVNPGFTERRIGGIQMQPEWNALVLSLAFCVLLFRLDREQSLGRIGWLAAGGLYLWAIYLTYTRGAWLGLLLAGVPLFWQRSAARGVTLRRRALFLVGVLGFAVLVLLAPGEVLQERAGDVDTVYFRFNVWIAGFQMLAQNPLLGVGFGQFTYNVAGFIRAFGAIPTSPGLAQSGTMAHNTFLSVAAELGLVGLALYIFILLGVFRNSQAAATAAWGQRGRTWIAGYTIIYLVNVQFIVAHELVPNVLFFSVLGAIAGMRGFAGGPSDSDYAVYRR
jgi:O-antigen ligase